MYRKSEQCFGTFSSLSGHIQICSIAPDHDYEIYVPSVLDLFSISSIIEGIATESPPLLCTRIRHFKRVDADTRANATIRPFLSDNVMVLWVSERILVDLVAKLCG
jgi:hypothetical protein